MQGVHYIKNLFDRLKEIKDISHNFRNANNIKKKKKCSKHII